MRILLPATFVVPFAVGMVSKANGPTTAHGRFRSSPHPLGDTLRLGSLTAAVTFGFVMLLAHGPAAEAAAVKRIGATPITAVIKALGRDFAREACMVS
jgi:hypothetical protein